MRELRGPGFRGQKAMKKAVFVLPVCLALLLLGGCTSPGESPVDLLVPARTTSPPRMVSPFVGHRFEIQGQNYQSDPSVPTITGEDLLHAKQNVSLSLPQGITVGDGYDYLCFDLKNEGTQAFTTAESATAGTSSRDQMMHFYRTAMDTIQREENCQAFISRYLPSEEFNLGVSQSDENAEINRYNRMANSFNSAIMSCQGDQIIGRDGLCHDPCSGPTLYCPPDSSCEEGSCVVSTGADGYSPSYETPVNTYIIPDTPVIATSLRPNAYVPGDIVNGLMVLAYDEASDQYTLVKVTYMTDSTCYTFPVRVSRKEVDSGYTYSGHTGPGIMRCG